ncbi:MAG: DUF4349 domain-containing protein [Clostridiales bacterium]|nr:DUF4349 domain-containing protein [Clostridiales bacterium]
MRKTTRYIAAATLCAAMLMTGCGRSNKSADQRISVHNDEATYITAETTAAVAEYERGFTNEAYYAAGATADYGNAEYAASDYEEYYEAPMETSSSTASAPANGTIAQQSDVLTDRMLIRYVTISCETLNFTQLTSDIEAQVSSLGGYIESKNFYGTGNNNDLRSASYTIRVASASLDALVNMIGNGATVTYSNESTEDVTLSYADTQARIESLRVEQETLNNLLSQADSLDIILQLQNELTYVRYQIESYESQLRVLENLSSYSTLTLNITEVLEETEIEEPHIKTYSEKISDAFQDGLDHAKNTFQDLGLQIAENVIPIAVIIILVIAAIIVIKVVTKKIKKRRAKAKASAEAQINTKTAEPEVQKPSTTDNKD